MVYGFNDDKSKADIYLPADSVIVNFSTGTHGKLGYSIDMSYDGLTFQPIAGFSGRGPQTDVRVYRDNDTWYLLGTGAGRDVSTSDFGYTTTQDFKNIVWQQDASLGLVEYRNEKYPEASGDNRRWTPGIFKDADGRTYAYVSLRKTLETSGTVNIFGRAVGYFGIFAAEVSLDDGELTAIGEPFEIIFDNPSVYDACFFVKDGTLCALARTGYTQDTFYAESTSVDNFTIRSNDVFRCMNSEAPNVLEINGTYYIYGQSFNGKTQVNLCVTTKDFSTFTPVGMPRKIGCVDSWQNKYMRNMNPFIIKKSEYVELFGQLPNAISCDAPIFNGIHSGTEWTAFDKTKNGNRIHGALNNVITCPDNVTDINIDVCRAWGNKIFIKRTALTNSAIQHPITTLNVAYYSTSDELLTSAQFKIMPYVENIAIELFDNSVQIFTKNYSPCPLDSVRTNAVAYSPYSANISIEPLTESSFCINGLIDGRSIAIPNDGIIALFPWTPSKQSVYIRGRGFTSNKDFIFYLTNGTSEHSGSTVLQNKSGETINEVVRFMDVLVASHYRMSAEWDV